MNAAHTPTASAKSPRERLLDLMQVSERQLELAGIPTSVQMSSPRISCLLDLASQIEQLGRVGSPTMG